MSKIKTVLALVAAFVCGGVWAIEPVVKWDGDLVAGEKNGYTLSYRDDDNQRVAFANGQAVLTQNSNVSHGLIVSWDSNDESTIQSQEMTVLVRYYGYTGSANHALLATQWESTSKETVIYSNGAHTRIGISKGVTTSSYEDQVTCESDISTPAAGIMMVTFANAEGELSGTRVAFAPATAAGYGPFELKHERSAVKYGEKFKGLKIGGTIGGNNHFYRPGMKITGLAIYDRAMTLAEAQQLPEFTSSTVQYSHPAVLQSDFVSTGWKVSSVDELVNWNFTGEMIGGSVGGRPVVAKGCFPVTLSDGTVKVEFQASNVQTKGVSAIFRVVDGIVEVKGKAACYFNAANRVGESMFNDDGTPRNPGGTTIASTLATGFDEQAYGIQNVFATPNYYMCNASGGKAKANYSGKTYTLNLPATTGYAVGSRVVVKSIGLATEGSTSDLPAKIEVNGVKSASRVGPVSDPTIQGTDNVTGYMITYNFTEPLVLSVGTAATSFKFLNASDEDVTANSQRFAVVSRATASGGASTGMKFSAVSISEENSWAPICMVAAEPIAIDPSNEAMFSGTLPHTSWTVLGKVAEGETINDVALKYGIAAQMGGGSINGGTPLDAVDRYAQVHTDNILTVEMQCQDGNNKKAALVGLKVEGGLLYAKWLKSSYKQTTANDRQMTYADSTVTINNGFTAHDYEVTTIVISKADLLKTAIDKPSVLVDNDNLKLHFDASSLANFTIENGEVTQWNDLAGSNNATPGTATKGYVEVVNGVPAFQMGDAGSGIDLQFNRQTDIRTVFWVMDIKTTMNAFFLGDVGNSCYNFHRGSNGEYAYGQGGFNNASIRCDGMPVNATTDIVPTGLHVYSAKMASNSAANRLSQDRTQAGRNGGRALSELIVFNAELTDAQIKEVNEYLLSKWKGLVFTPLATELAAGETNFTAIQWNDDQVYARGAVATVAVNASATLNIDSDVMLSSLKLTGSGALTIANAQSLSFGAVDVSEFTGSIVYKVDATAADFTADVGLRTFMKAAGDSVTFVFNGSSNTGVTIDYGSSADTGSAAIFSCHIVFDGGAHALKYVHENAGSKFGANATQNNPTLRVTNGTTLNLTGKNWCGWSSGAVDAHGIIRVDSGATLNANTDSIGTFYWAQQFYLEPGSTANFRSNNDNVRFNGGIDENAPQIYVPTCAVDKANKVATVSLTNNANLEIRNQGNGGAAFYVGENATLKIVGNMTGGSDFTKYGDGILEITGDVTNTGTKTIAAGLYEMGATRDFTAAAFTTSGTGAFLIRETVEEYSKANISVMNPNEEAIKVIRPNDTTIYDYATVEADTEAKIAGIATIFDITFKNNKDDIGKAGGGGGHFDYKANANANLKWDNAAVFTKTADEEWDDTVGCYLRTHPYIDSAAGTFAALTDFSVVVVGQMSPTDNRQFISIGSSDGTKTSILIATTGVKNQVMIATASGSTVNTATAVYATVPNATTARHAYVITRVGNTMTVYADGTKRGQITLPDNFALGTSGHSGIQVGSDFGGAIQRSGSYAAVANTETETGYINVIRVYDYVLSNAQEQEVFRQYPYVSENGLFTRTLTEDENDLQASAAWTNSETGETADLPADNASATLTLTADSSLTLNANKAIETLTIGGAGTLTVKAGTGTVSVSDTAIINTPVVIPYGTIVLAGTPITLGEVGSVKFDCSSIDVSTDYVVTTYQLTGLMDQENEKVTATLPTADAGHTVELVYVDGAYAIKVTPDHANGDRVYLREDGTYYADAQGENPTVKFPEDIVVLAEMNATLTTDTPLASGKVESGVTGMAVKVTANQGGTTTYSLYVDLTSEASTEESAGGLVINVADAEIYKNGSETATGSTTIPNETGRYTVKQGGTPIAEIGVVAVTTNATLDAGSTKATTLVAVPFKGLDGEAVKADRLVNTALLAAGDKLKIYQDGIYYLWTLNADKQWTSGTTVSAARTAEAPVAAETSVARGAAVWVTTANPIVVYGKYTTDDAPEASEGLNLMGNTTLGPLEPEASEGDQVEIPGDTSGVRTFTKTADGWTGVKTVIKTTVNELGEEVPVIIAGKPVKMTVDTDEPPSVPAGRGYFLKRPAPQHQGEE